MASIPQSTNPDLVDWEGPDDPMNPMNWPLRKKVAITITVALLTILTYETDSQAPFVGSSGTKTRINPRPLGSSIVAPAAFQIMEEFQQPQNDELSAFVVSVYLLGYAFGPMILAPLSELYGRNIVYHICNVLYLLMTIACALAPNLPGFMVCRLLAGTAGSAPLSIGAGSLADIIPSKNRGLAMGAWVLGPVLGPVIAPIGAYLPRIGPLTPGAH
ncbi:hypothetical protein N7519_005763 [Penicillium mononematosum]|uniref:uncharacterized protein n=1 Tax=Penicillium mononematosum TaxID=268346 RepID=UPI002546AC37|nr:uncharacterized protein N7519_005763 [Penicillium mononematosum]KAJ6184462.1 hypothetical protein N7519_005763 [Penicillium mononematosum]